MYLNNNLNGKNTADKVYSFDSNNNNFVIWYFTKIIYPSGNNLSCASTGNLLTESFYHTSLVSHIK